MAARALSSIVVCSAALLLAGQAMAQARDNYFARDRNVSVRERARPGYQALGLPLGGFLAYPKVELGAQYNSNIYGQPNHVANDVIGVVSPEIDLASQWSRNSLTAFARTSTREYASHHGADSTDWQVGGAGRADLGESTTNLSGDYGYLAEPRTASVGAANVASFATVHPIEYYLSDVKANLIHTFNRLQLEGDVTYTSVQFQNGVNAAGQVVAETPFDDQRTTATGKAGYAVNPDTAVYAAFAYNAISYPNQVVTATSANRNSQGETYDL